MTLRLRYIINAAGRYAWWGTAFAFLASRFWLQGAFALHISPSGSTILLVSRCFSDFWLVCVVVWIISILAGLGVPRKQTTYSTAAQFPGLQEALKLPSVAEAYRSSSLLSLTWSMDYRRTLLQRMKLGVLQPVTWLSNSVLGFYFAWVFPGGFMNLSSDIPSRCALFLVGLAVSRGISLVILAFQVAKGFPAHARIQHQGIIVETDGIRAIVGARKLVFEWAVVGQAKSRFGMVLYKRHGVQSVIPHFAFQSRTDMQAFVATFNALRAGLPPPPYDWSAYMPVETSTEGVWPPPIK